MSTLDDLRTTLDRHAAGLPDDHLPDRTGEVRARVRGVRRRRRAGAAGAVAAVLAVVGGLVLGPDAVDRSADRELAGATAPASLRSLGYTYAFDRGVEGAGSASVKLPAADRPRLVSWATSGSDRVSVDGPYDRHDAVSGDFADFQLVPGGRAATVKVSGDAVGTVGLAVYELTDQAPPGVTVDGITFRDEVGDQRLVGAVVGRAGETEVSRRLTIVPGNLRVKYLCGGVSGRIWVHLRVAGREDGALGGSGACDGSVLDPGASGTYSNVRLTEFGAVGDTVRVTVQLRRGSVRRAAPVEGADARVGFGLYRPGQGVRVGGGRQDAVVEDGGHVYREILARDVRDRRTEIHGLPARSRVRFALTYASAGIRETTVRHGGRSIQEGGGSRGGTVGVLSRGLGGDAVLTFRADDPSDHLGLTVYEQVD
jgi:hypothetical protein